MLRTLPSRSRHMRSAAVLAAVVTAGLVAPLTGAVAAPAENGTPYANPTSRDFADTFADPTVIRGKDGRWYAFGTTDPLHEGAGQPRHVIPIAVSDNLVDWEHAGDAFTEDNAPVWMDRDTDGPGDPPADNHRDGSIWAADIRYVDGEYRLYYVVTETREPGGNSNEVNDNAIGMATAPTILGPWTDSGEPVVGPIRRGEDNYHWAFDPHAITDVDGSQWLFYGSYYGGVHVVPLNDEGDETVGPSTMVAVDNKFEGAYVIRKGGYWYFFGSVANCCAGPVTGYSVHVGRSRDLTGPYVDREGVPLNQSRAGGTPVLIQNGNRWIGPGHNSIVTDLAGQDWIVYHALGRDDPWLNEPGGINERPMLQDRLDWVDGWPYVRADAGPSVGTQPGPVTQGERFTRFENGITAPFSTTGVWSTAQTDPQSGRYAEGGNQSTVTTPVGNPGRVRAEADVRGDAGIVLFSPPGRTAVQGTKNRNPGLVVNTGVGSAARTATTGRGQRIEVWVDTKANQLRARAHGSKGAPVTVSDALPANFEPDAWHSLVVEVRNGRLHAELTHARLFDPLATIDMALPGDAAQARRGGGIAKSPRSDVDNLSVFTAHTPVTDLVQSAFPDDVAFEDDFVGALQPGWTFTDDTRGNPDPTVVPAPGVALHEKAGNLGQLAWPIEDTDLNVEGNNSGLLLRDPPSQDGTWAVETLVTIDNRRLDADGQPLADQCCLNYQQGGLVVIANGDLFTRLATVSIWNTRQNEFGIQIPNGDTPGNPNDVYNAGTIAGPPGATPTGTSTYLRVVHTLDEANGEHELRAWTRRNEPGSVWVKGGTWTLPAAAQLRVGLVSQGRQGPVSDRRTSRFDYFRAYAD